MAIQVQQAFGWRGTGRYHKGTIKKEGGDLMAIVATPLASRLQLRVIVGYDSDDNPVLRTRSYTNIKPDAASDLLYLTGLDLASLQEHPLLRCGELMNWS